VRRRLERSLRLWEGVWTRPDSGSFFRQGFEDGSSRFIVGVLCRSDARRSSSRMLHSIMTGARECSMDGRSAGCRLKAVNFSLVGVWRL